MMRKEGREKTSRWIAYNGEAYPSRTSETIFEREPGEKDNPTRTTPEKSRIFASSNVPSLETLEIDGDKQTQSLPTREYM